MGISGEGELRALFESYGHLDRVSITRDRYTGQSRGCAFVEMSNHNEAEIAIHKLNRDKPGWVSHQSERGSSPD
jgi:RNA recognition motif-containing protein